MTSETSPAISISITSNAFWRWFPAGMRRRWWLFRLFDLFCRYVPIFKSRRGLVIIRMDGIGDMVLFRQSLDHYAEAFSFDKSEITVIGCNSWQSISDEIFAGYKVLCINEHAYARKLLYRFSINLKMRLLAPKIVVSDAFFRRALMADSLTWAIGAPKTYVSYPYISERTRSEFTYYLSLATDVIDTGLYPIHELDRHAAFISYFCFEPVKALPPVLNWRDKTPNIPVGKPYVVLNPGSNEYGRRWPLKDYVFLSKWLVTKNVRVVFVGGVDEKAKVDLIKEVAKDQNIIDMTGKTNLPELMDILNFATLVVSNDTGPMHLAIGLGTPTVAIIGGGHFGSFVPYPKEATPNTARFIYQRMDCYHCFWRCPKREDPGESFPCVAGVTQDQVQAACLELLSE
jgi:ADP-heptose:LPS heptosyltransferase